VFATSDRVTWGIAVAGALIVAMAKLAPFPLPGAQP
jgi:hypothetical protein